MHSRNACHDSQLIVDLSQTGVLKAVTACGAAIASIVVHTQIVNDEGVESCDGLADW